MLGMIEINLLPPEYRAPEGTNLPLIAALAIGVLVVGFTGLYGMNLSNELAQVESEYDKRLEVKTLLVSGTIQPSAGTGGTVDLLAQTLTVGRIRQDKIHRQDPFSPL